jgi:hypothetical protein
MHPGTCEGPRDARWNRDEPLAYFCLAPHAPYTVGDETLKRIVVLADKLDVPIHCHIHETQGEIAQGISQHGVRPLERLRRLGVVGPRLLAVHECTSRPRARPHGAPRRERRALPVVEPQARERHAARRRDARAASAWAWEPTA